MHRCCFQSFMRPVTEKSILCSAQQLGRIYRQCADPFSCRLKKSVCHGRGNGRHPHLTDPVRGVRALDDVDLHPGSFVHPEDWKIVEIALPDSAVFNAQRALQGGGEPEDDPACNLGLYIMGLTAMPQSTAQTTR